MTKFTIVVPTMWRYEPFPRFLNDLLDHEQIAEIILIDNDNTRRPAELPLLHKKLRVLDCDRNLFVNPSWNLGVMLSKTDDVVIMNDDIIFDLRVFNKVAEIDSPSFGLAGLCPGSEFYNQPPFVNGAIDIVPWNGGSMFGFGQLMFIKKRDYINIPYQLQVYWGDEWILHYLKDHKQIYQITNMFSHTPHAVTSKDVLKNVFNTDHQTLMNAESGWFNTYQALLNQLSDDERRQLIDAEYQAACNTVSDINEHVPTLYEYAMKCEHITEFGVRTGVSTRAFLKAGKTLRSYDLVQDATVQGLFYAARRIQDAKYYPADTLNLEIDRTDLLFIDTDHTYEQLSAELWLHADKVNKYIIFHDTTYHCADLVPAIFEFLDYHKGDWLIEKHFRNNNGLTIIKRKEVA